MIDMKKVRIILSCLLAVACAVVIFLFSAQTGAASAELSGNVMGPFGRILTALFGEAGHTVLRKCAHFILYCGLMFLTYNACFQARQNKRLSPVLPFILSVLYAVSDEIHQYFVPERACRLYDVGVDTLGCIVGGLCFFALAKLCIHLHHKRKSQEESQ